MPRDFFSRHLYNKSQIVGNKPVDSEENNIDNQAQVISNQPVSHANYKPIFSISYDGEKNSGELGQLIKYEIDYEGLRYRSWKSYLDDDVTQTVIKRFVTWIIGGGLKLQSEPIDLILKSNKIELPSDFAKKIEAKFKLFSKSKKTDYNGIDNLHRIAKTVKINALVGGDCLVILRYIDNQVNVQIVDGNHVQSPFGRVDVKNGIETKDNKVVAYWIRNSYADYKRIEAYNSIGQEVAFLVYGLRYRIDNNRGIPLISTVLNTLGNLDRYKVATVASAEERAKIVYQIVHQEYSSGESPLAKNIVRAFNVDAEQNVPSDSDGNLLANNVAATTNKQTFNMPQGSEMKALDSKQELSFKDFYTTNVGLICATVGIPPEVALSKYDSNFSASRAALKDWEHTINVEREDFTFQFYQKIYDFWFEIQVLQNNIQAPGYIEAMATRNNEVIDSYRNARFVGANVPHIDPLKEVNAERAKLGKSGQSLPLTTAEAATEALNGGEFSTNIEKYSQELQSMKDKKIEEPIKQ